MDSSLVTTAILFILGILLGQKLPLAPIVLLAAFTISLAGAVTACRARRMRLGNAATLVAVVIAGAFRGQLSSPELDPAHFVNRQPFGPGRFQVRLVDDPARLSEQGKATVDLTAVWRENRWAPLGGRLRLTLAPTIERGPSFSYGDGLEVAGLLSPPRGDRIGPAMTVRDLLATEGIHGLLRATRPPQMAFRAGWTVHGTLFELRHRIGEMLDRTHPPEVAAFIRAVLLDLRDLPADLLADYRTTGTYHLLSLSGSHVGILTMVLFALVSVLKLSRRLGGLLVMLTLVGYALMTGESPSVLRATLMASVFIVGRMLHRPTSIYTALAFSALVLLIANPLAVYQPGFQLSFVAVLSIAYLTPPIMTRIDFLPPYLNTLISTSLSATLGTAPILALSFGELSLVSPLANLLVIPLFGIILPVALLGVVGSLASPWIPFFFGAANYGFVTLMSTLIHHLARLPYAAVDVTGWPPGLWILGSLSLVVLGDYRNLREVATRRSRLSDRPEVATTPAGEIDSEALARTARELACLLPEKRDADDPISARLASVRGVIRGHTHELAPEFLLRCESLVAEPWAGALDSLTVAYLSLAEALFIAGRSPDKSPALLLLLKAVEHELNVHLFGTLRRIPGLSRVGSLTGRYPNHPLVNFLASPPRNLSLEQQNELLWAMITHQDRPLKALARAITRGLARNVSDVGFFLDPSRFPLRLDQVYKRFFLRLDKESWDWEGVRRAREEILGPKQENLFEQIGRALGGREKGTSAQDPGPAQGSGEEDDETSGQPLERVAWDRRSEAS